MSHAIVGVVGHVDHGKTALVRALTGQDTDRLPEERRRGISIALGFAHLALDDGGVLDLIDVPGHERFVRTMVAGATGFDAILLAVAADDGIRPQTIEHADIAALLGLEHAIVAVTKADLVSPRRAIEVGEAACGLLTERGIAAPSALAVVAPRGTGIAALRKALAQLPCRARPDDRTVWLPIDRAFHRSGHGAVVTGTLRGGAVARGDVLEVSPGNRAVRVREVQVHGSVVATASPGWRVALNLRDVAPGELGRGMALAEPRAILPRAWLTIALRSVRDAPPLANGASLRALYGTGEQDARLRLLDRDVLAGDAAGLAQLRLAEPASLPVGEHLVLRIASPAATVAGGVVIETGDRRLARRDRGILTRLARLRDLPPGARTLAEVEALGPAGTTVARLAEMSGLRRSRVLELLRAAPVIGTRAGLVVSTAALDMVMERILARLAVGPDGMSGDTLLAGMRCVGVAVLDEALRRLAARGAIVRRGGRHALPDAGRDASRAQRDAAARTRTEAVLARAGLAPPDPAALAADPADARAIERLLRDGVIIRAIDRAKGRQLLFHRDAVAGAKVLLSPLLCGEPGLLVTEIAAALGISRKYVMPLLDHLDGIRFTKRIGDRRQLHHSERIEACGP